MNTPQIFNFEQNEVRTILVNDEPYFVGKDVADVLGYSNPQKAIRDHVDLEDKTQNDSFTVNGTAVVLINESGLYSLILKSKLPSAKKFKRWVTSEVLPAIRKHGGYLTPEKVEEALLNPDTIIQLATQLKEERTGRLIAEQKIAEYEPKISYLDSILSSTDSVTI
ncbi:TPA: BRO family protein, partial [Enterococcus faecium]